MKGSHSRVGRSSTLGSHPVDVLSWVFDVTCLAVDAVLSIDLQPHSFSLLHRHVLIHTCRTEPLLWTIIESQIVFNWDTVIHQSEVGRLVVLVVSPCQSYRREKVKADHSVRFRVFYWLAVFSQTELGVVW